MFDFDTVRELNTMTDLLKSIRYGEIVGLPDSSPFNQYCGTLGGSTLNEAYWVDFYILKGEPEVADNFFDRFRRNAVVYMDLYDDADFKTAYKKFCEEFKTAMKMKEKENETMDLNLKDKLVFGYEDAFNQIVELVDDIKAVIACDDGELNIDYILRRCKKFDEWTKTLHYPNEIWYKDVTDRAVDCVRGYLVGFDMTHVFGNFMNTVVAHSHDDDIPKEAGQPLKRLIHSLWVLTYGDELDFNSNDADIYQKEALLTECGMLNRGDPVKRLLNGLMGLNGEAGECIDLLKKHLFQGHPLDFTELAEELGDVAWYLAISADALGYKLSDIFNMNIKKLEKRYPDGFEAEKSVNREA